MSNKSAGHPAGYVFIVVVFIVACVILSIAFTPKKEPLIVEPTIEFLQPTEILPNSISQNVLLDVPLLGQLPEYPAGCEAASVAMMVSYAGHPEAVSDIIAMMPYSDDPYLGYVGDPKNPRGYTIFPSGMSVVVEEIMGTSEDLSGLTLDTLEWYLRDNRPVAVWLGYGALPGTTIHCVTLTGFDEENVYYNDPYTYIKDTKMSKVRFKQLWSEFGNKALSY